MVRETGRGMSAARSPERPVARAVDAVRKARNIGDVGLYPLCAIANAFSPGSQTIRARQSINQANTEIMLEHVDTPGHGGMVDPQLFGRPRKAPGFGQREKEFQVVPVHARLRINAHPLCRNLRSADGDTVSR
jgi:hypothetical protein